MTDAQCVAIIAAILQQNPYPPATAEAIHRATERLDEAKRQLGEPPKMETK